MSFFDDPKLLLNINKDKKLTKTEIIGLLRHAICLEHGAVQTYKFIADNCDWHLVEKVMKDLANEEVVHIGELDRLIFELDDNERELYIKGFKEVEDKI